MSPLVSYLRTVWAALRILLLFTLLFGIAYPLVVLGIAQVPGLQHRADGSPVTASGKVVGSALIGQSFVDAKGTPLAQYFQSRPSAAGQGYDPTATSASNLGPESIIDTLADPARTSDSGRQSLLTQVCARSLAIGILDGVDGSRPFCTPDGVGAVLAVFWSGPGYSGTVTGVVSVNQACPAAPFLSTYRGVRVTCGRFGQDYSRGQVVPVRGSAPARPAVPADAVTASASGLDAEISPAFAQIQESVVAKSRHVTVGRVAELVASLQKGRDIGFMGEPRVNVLQLNLALDRQLPMSAH